MVQIKPLKFNKISTSQRVAKKHLKLHVKRLRDLEYSRLREMVPSIASKEKVSKVGTCFFPNKNFQGYLE